jgi:putative YhdH/YhfP family quinone oxidoreductase
MERTFKALVVRQDGAVFTRQIETRDVAELPAGEVLVRVAYSSLNYKDALSASGNKGVTRAYPHTPGIDAAGSVVESSSPAFCVGDEVIVTGYDLGMNTAGGFGGYIRVPAAWPLKRPPGLTLKESMVYGTAGFTAALSVFRLIEYGIQPESGPVLVTGATGGVGSLAVGILALAGYQVTAATGKAQAEGYLRDLGAAKVIPRAALAEDSGKPLGQGEWAGVVDTVGGDILATALKTVRYGGAVTCCGMVASPTLQTTVFPFILRGVSLLGIDSVACPQELRQQLWNKIAWSWKLKNLESLYTSCDLAGLEEKIEAMLAGKSRGRVVVELEG